MKIYRNFDSLPSFKEAVVTLGSFDGLHRGHLSLLDAVKSIATTTGGESIVLTFEPHPRVVLGRVDGLRLLTSTEEKILLLEQYGIDNLIIISFDRVFSRFSHHDFIKKFLVDKLSVSTLVVGYDHHMGRGSEGGYDSLVRIGAEFGFNIHRVDEWCDEWCDNVSSTVVRQFISSGDIDSANRLLSRPYLIIGQVDSDGRVWSKDALKLLPTKGVYRVLTNGVESQLRVDERGALWCDELGQRVVIEVLERAN